MDTPDGQKEQERCPTCGSGDRKLRRRYDAYHRQDFDCDDPWHDSVSPTTGRVWNTLPQHERMTLLHHCKTIMTESIKEHESTLDWGELWPMRPRVS
jgi:hypothetical protein